jgi:hypothetical protein
MAVGHRSVFHCVAHRPGWPWKQAIHWAKWVPISAAPNPRSGAPVNYIRRRISRSAGGPYDRRNPERYAQRLYHLWWPEGGNQVI